jgi:hypothetical protein
MKIKLHDNSVFENPDGATLQRLLFELDDAGDFIILSDDKLGEIRAAGPDNKNFLVQCDLPSCSGVFEGEQNNVNIAQVQSMFLAFLSGDLSWKRPMSDRNPKLSEAIRNPFGIFLVVIVLLAIYFLIKKFIT